MEISRPVKTVVNNFNVETDSVEVPDGSPRDSPLPRFVCCTYMVFWSNMLSQESNFGQHTGQSADVEESPDIQSAPKSARP